MDTEMNLRRWLAIGVGWAAGVYRPASVHNPALGVRMEARASLVLFLALGLAAISSAAEDTWTRKANMPTARSALSTATVGGKVYAIGGRATTSSAAISTVEEYDPATDTWTSRTDMPTPRMLLGACALNGKIYAIGGRQGPAGDPLSTVEEYDPATDKWTRRADMPTARRCSVSAVNGKIYAIGGRGAVIGGIEDYGEDLSVVEEYDPATDTWTRRSDMPTARSGPCTSVVNERIYAIGGFTGIVGEGTGIYSTMEEYDPATDSWTARTPMQTPRAAFAACAVGGRIYAFAGTPFTTYLSTVEAYDVATDTWEYKANIPTARSNFGASAVGGKIYVIGGRTWGNVVISTVEEYDTGLATPSPDFNGNGTVDIKDLLRVIESWGQHDPSLDIAPAPFGDGVIDAADLEVLMNCWGQEVADPTLEACWKLDEAEGDVAYDSVGENDAVVVGDAVWQPAGGAIDGALEFNGMTSVVAGPVLNPSDGPFSVFAWIKGGAPGQVILSQADGANWLMADSSQGFLMTGLRSSGRSSQTLCSETVITDDSWHRVGLVWEGAARILYVDDVEVAGDVQGNLAGTSAGLYIGAGKALEPGSFFSGLIDDVRIYSRAVTP